jgi:hypothetical protein
MNQFYWRGLACTGVAGRDRFRRTKSPPKSPSNLISTVVLLELRYFVVLRVNHSQLPLCWINTLTNRLQTTPTAMGLTRQSPDEPSMGSCRLSGVLPSGHHVIVKVIHLDRLRYRPGRKIGLRSESYFCLNPLRQYKPRKSPIC